MIKDCTSVEQGRNRMTADRLDTPVNAAFKLLCLLNETKEYN